MAVNILYLIDSIHIGGTEKQLIKLVENIDRGRYQPHIGTLKRSGKLLESLDAPVLTLDFRSFAHPSAILQVVKLLKYIRRHDIQIVQTFFQDPFLLAAMVKPFSRVKLIGSFRDLGFWRTRAEAVKMSMAYPFFSGFVANSQAVKNHFVAVDGIPADKIKVIYNGIKSVNLLTGGAEKPDGQPPLIGIVANCNRKVKRVDDFIRTAALVKRNCPSARFVVLGDGYLRPELEELGKTLGLGEALTFAGRVENPLDYVSKFDVGVITSETEGFCNAILEYMACGVPVVATGSGGNSELVTDGENGFLVPVGDVETMARKIENLLNNHELRKRSSEENRAKVNKNFTLSKMVENYQNVYGCFV